MKKLLFAMAIGAFVACGDANEAENTTPPEETMQENQMPPAPVDTSAMFTDTTAAATDTSAAH